MLPLKFTKFLLSVCLWVKEVQVGEIPPRPLPPPPNFPRRISWNLELQSLGEASKWRWSWKKLKWILYLNLRNDLNIFFQQGTYSIPCCNFKRLLIKRYCYNKKMVTERITLNASFMVIWCLLAMMWDAVIIFFFFFQKIRSIFCVCKHISCAQIMNHSHTRVKNVFLQLWYTL